MRFGRGADVTWAQIGELAVAAGDVVVVASPTEERLALVAVSPDQILEHPFSEPPEQRLLRLAEADDIQAFQRAYLGRNSGAADELAAAQRLPELVGDPASIQSHASLNLSARAFIDEIFGNRSGSV